MDTSKNLEMFAEYWKKKVDTEECSPLTRLEWIILVMYEKWRLKQKEAE